MTPTQPFPRVTWCGDEYVIVHLSDGFDMHSVADAMRLQQLILESSFSEVVVDSLAGWCTLLLRLEPGGFSAGEIEKAIGAALLARTESAVEFSSRVITIPTHYGGAFGPDFDLVVQVNKLSGEEVIARLEATQFAGMVSFSPGMANCMWLEEDKALSAPKYESPRTHTPVGTVGLGGSSISLYSVDSPGGFQMVGRMAVPIYSAEPILPEFEAQPALLESGDRLILKSVDSEEYQGLQDQVSRGDYTYDITPGRCCVDEDALTWT